MYVQGIGVRLSNSASESPTVCLGVGKPRQISVGKYSVKPPHPEWNSQTIDVYRCRNHWIGFSMIYFTGVASGTRNCTTEVFSWSKANRTTHWLSGAPNITINSFSHVLRGNVSSTIGSKSPETKPRDGRSYGVYISQLIRFARVCNHVTDFNARN